MKKVILLLTLTSVILWTSCTAKKGSEEFSKFSARFVEAMWVQYPNNATMIGKHDYDSIMTIRDEAKRKENADFSKKYLDSLNQFDFNQLTQSQKTDFLLIQNNLKSNELVDVLKTYEWDPSSYNFGDVAFEIINNKIVPSSQKVKNLSQFLSKSEQFFDAAIKQIKVPTKEHNDIAISQLEGTKSMLNGLVRDSFKAQHFDESAINQTILHIDKFRNHLIAIDSQFAKGTLIPKSFRIGKEAFTKKFDYEIQSKYTAEEIYKKAVARKASLHTEMYQYSAKLWAKYLGNVPMPKDTIECIKMVIDKVAMTHVSRESFQSEIQREIPILTNFINEKKLLTMDPTKPLEVRKEPEWMAGVAGASISSPGPYDKEGFTYYNVGSLAAYTPEAAESYLREYNQYTLQILNIHEAIPGHYVQLIYSNKAPSLIQTLFGNGAMVEGWAVYSERMMMEEGWDKNTTINKTSSPDEMWLMYLKWHLRAVCNTILDYSVHCNNMSETDALQLLMHDAFQEKTEAQGKWRRSTLTQVQLCSYFTGFTEIYELRETKKKQQGFNLKAFHEKFLSFGSAPVKYIAEMWDK